MCSLVCVCVSCLCLTVDESICSVNASTCKCGCLLPLLPPFHSGNICHQLQHTPCLSSFPLFNSPYTLPLSLLPSSDKGSSVTHHLKGRLRLGKRSLLQTQINSITLTNVLAKIQYDFLSLTVYLLPRLYTYARAYAQNTDTHRRSDTYLSQRRCFQ